MMVLAKIIVSEEDKALLIKSNILCNFSTTPSSSSIRRRRRSRFDFDDESMFFSTTSQSMNAILKLQVGPHIVSVIEAIQLCS